jgi:hypothetical protein
MWLIEAHVICLVIPCDTPPNSLVDSTMNLNVKTTKGQSVVACSLTHNISGVEGRAEVS